MGRLGRLCSRQLVVFAASMIEKADLVFSRQRHWRIGLQVTIFSVGLKLVTWERGPCWAIDAGFVLACLAALAFLVEVAYYGLLRRCVTKCIVRSFVKALRMSSHNTRWSFVAARVEDATEAWLARNCRQLDRSWLAEELKKVDLSGRL